MGAILSLMLTGFVVIGIYKFVTQPDTRRGFLAEFAAQPLETAFALVWVACWLTFFWGVFIPEFGTIKIPIFGKRYELWAVAGIASFAGFALMCSYVWLRTPRPPR